MRVTPGQPLQPLPPEVKWKLRPGFVGFARTFLKMSDGVTGRIGVLSVEGNLIRRQWCGGVALTLHQSRVAGGPLCAGTTVAVVEPLAAQLRRGDGAGVTRPLADLAPEGLGVAGQPRRKRQGVGGVAALCEPRSALWHARVGGADDEAVWSGISISPARTATATRKRFLIPFLTPFLTPFPSAAVRQAPAGSWPAPAFLPQPIPPTSCPRHPDGVG